MSLLDVPKTSSRWVSLTPLIDVVFILILFFMLTTQFEQRQTLSVNSATPGNSAPVEELLNDNARVRVLSSRAWQLNDRDYSFNDANGLKALLSYASVRITAADGVVLQDVINLIDEFGKAGISDVLWIPSRRLAGRE